MVGLCATRANLGVSRMPCSPRHPAPVALPVIWRQSISTRRTLRALWGSENSQVKPCRRSRADCCHRLHVVGGAYIVVSAARIYLEVLTAGTACLTGIVTTSGENKPGSAATEFVSTRAPGESGERCAVVAAPSWPGSTGPPGPVHGFW